MPPLPLFPTERTPQGLETLVDLLFSGVSERPIWASFLRALARRLDGVFAAFVFSDDRSAFNGISIVTADSSEASLLAPLLDSGLLALLEQNYPAGIIAEVAQRVCVGLCLQLEGQKSYMVVLGQHNNPSLATDWPEVLRALSPFLQRMAPIYAVIGDCERRRLVAEHVLETSGIGVVLVDRDARIIVANTVARSILAESGVASIVDARLRATRAADQKLLIHHISQKANEQAAISVEDRYVTFALEQSGSPHPITVIVRPGPSYAPVSAPLKRTAVVILRDPSRRSSISVANLERLFDLTPAEARLASLLADGLSLTEAAAELDVRRTTVRSQLQSIFVKTGTNRQGDLVRLLLSSAAPLSQQKVGNDAQ